MHVLTNQNAEVNSVSLATGHFENQQKMLIMFYIFCVVIFSNICYLF